MAKNTGVIQSQPTAKHDLVPTIDYQDFVAYLVAIKGLQSNSVKNCRLRFLSLIKFLNTNKLPISASSVESFLYYLRTERHLGNNSLNTYVFMARQLDAYARHRELSWCGFSEKLSSYEKTRPIIEVLTIEEIEKILSVDLTYGVFRGTNCDRLNRTYKTMLLFLATTGCRFDECASLLVRNLDMFSHRATFVNTKNKQPRFAYLSPELCEHLKQEVVGKGWDDPVFTSMLGKKIVPQSFIEDLKKRVAVALPGSHKRVYPHLFRHSFATQLITSGADITRVASILGHKDIQTTYQNYVHLADDLIRKATQLHPMIRKSIDPSEVIKNIREYVESMRLNSDPRLTFTLTETSGGLSFSVTY